jgi:hypothetical protein
MNEGQAYNKQREFELYLVSFMRLDRHVMAKALQELHSTESELETVRRLMTGRGYQMIGGPSVDFYREMLGEPIFERPIDNNTVPEPFRDSTELHYKLSLWPDFDFVVNQSPTGGTFDATFRRSEAARVPLLESFSDLEPWKFVKDEVDACFGPPNVGDAWDNWEELEYMIPKSAGSHAIQCSLLFDFNLLQSANWKVINERIAAGDDSVAESA